MLASEVRKTVRLKPYIPRLCGRAIFRPWFDAIAVRAVTRGYFPLSRGWAAAWAADGDLHRFCETLGVDLSGFAVRKALASIRRSAAVYAAESAIWDEAFFGCRMAAAVSAIATGGGWGGTHDLGMCRSLLNTLGDSNFCSSKASISVILPLFGCNQGTLLSPFIWSSWNSCAVPLLLTWTGKVLPDLY